MQGNLQCFLDCAYIMLLRSLLIAVLGRYLHVRLIMFRPVLSALLHSTCNNAPPEQDNSMESAMRQGMLDRGVKLCISSACDLVELITSGLDIYDDILPPPWHNVFCKCSIS